MLLFEGQGELFDYSIFACITTNACLDLKDSIPQDAEGLSTYPAINLPCLRVLRISSGVGALTTALRHIACPSSVMLNLTWKESRSNKIDFSNFFSVLATNFLSSLVIQSLSLYHVDTVTQNSLKFLVSTTAMIQGCLPSIQLELVLTWPSLPAHNRLKYAKVDAMKFSPNYNYQLLIISIPKHCSRLLENFLYWNGCTWMKLRRAR